MDSNRQLAVSQLQAALGYMFKEHAWLELALTHSSVGGRDNERLEFLGDSVLGFVISEQLYKQFPNEDEGALTRLRARLVRGQTLGELAAEMQLGNCLLLGSGERKTGGSQRKSILANALEAVLGAILLDGGFNAVRESILNIFKSRLNQMPPAASLKDAKTRLQEYLQARGHRLPEYELVKKAGPDHARVFTVRCQVSGRKLQQGDAEDAHQVLQSVASASNRRQAEQQAAADILRQLDPQNDH